MNRFSQKQSDIQRNNSFCNTSTFPTVVTVDSQNLKHCLSSGNVYKYSVIKRCEIQFQKRSRAILGTASTEGLQPFSFRNLTEYLLTNYLNSFWHKMYFIIVL